ncbi:hypothetical protein [Nocardia terpenica]|uniref:Condensation domain-containing protein n=1 Tax=Nocardia terpenica TaxID=455432 RepID=A0A6G9ZAE5_9NOCA|nr:hypothetical protein [Nocardia terpenica]QIS22136.1 hypothetical protein F6W96_31115 [Nocardia terpenica]
MTDQDEAYLHAPFPMCIQFEVRVAGQLCAERLENAVIATARHHPLARARLVPGSAMTIRHAWEIPNTVDKVRIDVVECGKDDSRVASARARAYADTASVGMSPPFTLTLAHHGDGDYLMLNLSHAVGDATSAYRLMSSILSAYHRGEEPGPLVTALDTPRFRVRPTNGHWPTHRFTSGVRMASVTEGPELDRNSHKSSNRGAERIRLVRIGREATESVLARRRRPGTVNDMLLAALVESIRRWNADHNGEVGPVNLLVAVNTRPPERQFEGLGNLAAGAIVSIPPTVPTAIEPMIDTVASQMLPVRENRAGRSPLDLPSIVGIFPSALKKALAHVGSLRFRAATSLLSNLGVLEWPDDLESGTCAVREVWFSPPLGPLPLCVGVASTNDELFVCLRYNDSHIWPAAAAEFADLYREVLIGPH